MISWPAVVMHFVSIIKRIIQKTKDIELFLARICKFIDIPVMSIHGLRHEHASFLASQGVPTKTIAARLGHVDDRVTNKVYIHETMHDQKRDARAVMDKLADMQ